MKKSTLSIAEQQHLKNIYDWTMTVEEFFENTEPTGDDWRNDFEELKMTKSDLSGWTMAYNDSMEMVRDLPPEKYKELDEILKDKFGHGLLEADKKYVEKINKIVAKGKIRNEEQYYMLREYFERIWDMEEYKETAQKIDTMLHESEAVLA